MKSPFRFLITALALSTTLATAATPKVITKLPYIISKPGDYALSKTLNYTGNTDAITVQADDVTIDLRGNLLNYAGTDGATITFAAILGVGRKNVTVRNGTIRGFFRGVFFEDNANSAGITVENIVADHCTFLGLQVKGRAAIVRHNRVRNVGGSTAFTTQRYGIFLQSVGGMLSDNVVTDVRLDGATLNSYGIFLTGSESLVAQRNSALNSQESANSDTLGLYVENCPGAFIEGNRIARFETGLAIKTSLGLVFRDNTVTSGLLTYNASSGVIDGGGNVP